MSFMIVTLNCEYLNKVMSIRLSLFMIWINLLHYSLTISQLGVVSVATAQDVQRGLAALQAGDYATALQELTPLAKAGNAYMQQNLGLMYELGQGVLQSNVMAHMWYNIASANGASKAGEWRDERAGEMTPADISKAQEMARECMASGYQNCGE